MKKDKTTDQPSKETESQDSDTEEFGPKITRRSFLKGTGAAAGISTAPIYLSGITRSFAENKDPVFQEHRSKLREMRMKLEKK